MLTIQEVTEVISQYRRNKGFIKKITRTDHPAILAAETYLNSLQRENNFLSNQDLFKINRFFLLEHPVKPGKASYTAWAAINYQNFCALNYGLVKRLTELLKRPVPIKYTGFATCNKAGYQYFSEHFAKLTLEQLDSRSNAEKIHEFFQVLTQSYQENSLNDDRFLAFSKLCVEGMLTPEYVNLIKQSKQADFLAKCLIKMKHTDTLTTKNQDFILIYPGTFIIPITHTLIALDKAGLNTSFNRAMLGGFSSPIPLHRTVRCLEKKQLLTQENFGLISAESNIFWLLALEEMPEELISTEVWDGLVNLSQICNENELRKNIRDYAELLKKQLNVQQIEKDVLASENQIETQAATTPHFFSVTPVNLSPSTEDEVPKVNFAP